MPVKSAAECSVAELNARGLHYMDLAEQSTGTTEPCSTFTRIAQGYFQAVTAATAIALSQADGGEDL